MPGPFSSQDPLKVAAQGQEGAGPGMVRSPALEARRHKGAPNSDRPGVLSKRQGGVMWARLALGDFLPRQGLGWGHAKRRK